MPVNDLSHRPARTSLERARWDKGYSREYVARVLGISAKTVERHEYRATRIRRGLLLDYADLYGVDVSALVDISGEAA